MKRLDVETTSTAPVARATVEAVASALKITPTERLYLAELIRTRKLSVSREGALAMDQLLSLLREIRGK
jgi:hypothetical protein